MIQFGSNEFLRLALMERNTNIQKSTPYRWNQWKITTTREKKVTKLQKKWVEQIPLDLKFETVPKISRGKLRELLTDAGGNAR